MPSLEDFDAMELEDDLQDVGAEDEPEVLFEVADVVFGRTRPASPTERGLGPGRLLDAK